MIYLDNAATTMRKPPEVTEAVVKALSGMGNAGRGAHEATLQASRIVYRTRELLAELFGISRPEQIAFTCNATESLNIAINGLFHEGDHVITTVCEHNSVLRPLYRKEKEGVELTIVPFDKRFPENEGRIDYDFLEKSCKENTKAIVITNASNVTGNITDLKRVSSFAKKRGILLIVDASQTAGVLPIQVEEQGIDVLCFTGHKGLLGPQGTGGIYVREGLELSPLKVGGSGVQSFLEEHPRKMPTALEAGTLNVHGIAGLKAALEYIKGETVEKIREKEMRLWKRFEEQVREIPDVIVYGNPNPESRVGIVALNIGKLDSGEVSDWLWEDYEIAVRPGAHCAPLLHKALGTVRQGAVRFSFSHYNTEQEIDVAAAALREYGRDEV